MKTRWPKELPVFKVLSTNYGFACKPGDVVEGLLEGKEDRELSFYSVPDPLAYWGATYRNQKSNAILRPLTAAARAMAVIAKAGK